MKQRSSLLLLCCGLLLSIVWAAQGSAAPLGDYPIVEPAYVGYPTHMTVFGDSISRAVNATNPLGEYLELVWATGSDGRVTSHATRIISATGALTVSNLAVSGADSNDLATQVLPLNPASDYIALLIGGNDACTTNEDMMTSVAQFRTNINQMLTTISETAPNARIYVASIPNIYRLWEVLKDNQTARYTWNLANICQSMLNNPLSTDQADIDRRARVLQRVVDYNTVLAEECMAFIHCRFDNNAVFNNDFAAADVSSIDFFHPSISGQAKIAAVTYNDGFDWSDTQAPVTTLQANQDTGEVTLSATDNVAVAGIEYQLNTGSWTKYTVPVAVGATDTLIFRAVDVNGNTEAARSFAWQAAPTFTLYLPFVSR